MPRYRLDLEYDGTNYCGFQRQNTLQEQSNKGSIQAAIEKALYRYSSENITIVTAGRTDAGVHALHQVVHFDMQRPLRRGVREITGALNALLTEAGETIAILDSFLVEPDFSARFSAKKRSYLYRIFIRNAPLTIDKLRAWHISHPLDIELMREGAALLCGRHDFTSFRSSECQAKSPVRTLDSIDIIEVGQEIHIYVKATSFLHNQVRTIVGTLYDIGRGHTKPNYIKQILAAKNRAKAGQNAPAHGLYLYKIEY